MPSSQSLILGNCSSGAEIALGSSVGFQPVFGAGPFALPVVETKAPFQACGAAAKLPAVTLAAAPVSSVLAPAAAPASAPASALAAIAASFSERSVARISTVAPCEHKQDSAASADDEVDAAPFPSDAVTELELQMASYTLASRAEDCLLAAPIAAGETEVKLTPMFRVVDWLEITLSSCTGVVFAGSYCLHVRHRESSEAGQGPHSEFVLSRAATWAVRTRRQRLD